MKKIIALGISFLLLVPLFGCKANEGDTSTTPNTQIEDGEVENGTEGDVEKQIEDASDGVDDLKNNTESKENTNE